MKITNFDSHVIEKQIEAHESLIIDFSKKVFESCKCDSLQEWIEEIMQPHNEISNYLGFPNSTRSKVALFTLVASDNIVKNPILHLVGNRLSIYLSSLQELETNQYSNIAIKEVKTFFDKLLTFIKPFQSVFYQKSVGGVADALKTHRLHIYQDDWVNTDLRVVLKTIYEDDKNDDIVKLNLLLDFIISQLKSEKNNLGHISEPRHIWWSIETLGRKASLEFIEKNSELINDVIANLLSRVEYSPRKDVEVKNITPELNTIEYETLWEVLNICRITSSKLKNVLSPKIAEDLKKRFEFKSIHLIAKPNLVEQDFKMLCVRLLFLYECKDFQEKNSIFIKNKELKSEPINNMNKNPKLKVFISYAHDNKDYFDVFVKKLRPHSQWDVWDDRSIPIGKNWFQDIQKNILESDFAILLISAEFFNSGFIQEHEYGKFMELSEKNGFLFFPVLLNDCDFHVWEKLSNIQFFSAHGEYYDVMEKKGQMIAFAEICKFNQTNGNFIPNSSIDTYMKNLVKKIKESIPHGKV